MCWCFIKNKFFIKSFLKKSYSHLKKNGILFLTLKIKIEKNLIIVFSDERHKWYKIKEVKNEVLRNKNFKILQFIGFDQLVIRKFIVKTTFKLFNNKK